MSKIINYGKQFIDDIDIFAVDKILRSDYLTTGPAVDKFENDLCEYTGYSYCSAVSSGTAALHCAMASLMLEKYSEVIVPAISFVATSNCVLYQGCEPVFCDVDEDTLLIDINKIEALINKNTKAIIAMDYAGQRCDYSRIKEICIKYGLVFILDACHSLGNMISNETIPYPDIICYSFHPVKHITTGEGGAALTNDDKLHQRMKSFRNHGRFGLEMVQLGFNYRMPDINAALGSSQLCSIDDFIERRRQVAIKYGFNLDPSIQLEQNDGHVYHLYVIKMKNRNKFIKYMRENDVICAVHYPPIYSQPYYKFNGYGHYKDLCPAAEKIKDLIVSLPMYYSLKDEEQDKVIKLVNEFMEGK
jgi:perosamine synthetase